MVSGDGPWHAIMLGFPETGSSMQSKVGTSLELIHAKISYHLLTWTVTKSAEMETFETQRIRACNGTTQCIPCASGCLFSALGLVHAYENLDSWFSASQIIYLHLPSALDRGGAMDF